MKLDEVTLWCSLSKTGIWESRMVCIQEHRSLLTKGSEGPLLGHQGKETRLQGICDDDVKQLFKILPVMTRETLTSVRWVWALSEGNPG